mgnify:CR=1 FL=1
MHSAAESKAKEGASRARGVDPKVFVPHARQVGLPPRKVEVERKKRHFARQNIAELLAAEGVDPTMPEPPEEGMAPSTDGTTFGTCLPLEAFDNTDYEVRSPAQWIEAAAAAGATGVPGTALYRGPAGVGAGQRWLGCTAVAWDDDQQKFVCEFADGTPSGLVGRLDLCFKAEDPFNFARRVAVAHQSRREAEALLRYNLYVDCMPTDDTPQLNTEQVNRVLSSALNTPALKQPGVDVSGLLDEVNMDYRRTMNKIIFDINLQQTSGGDSHMFSDLPDRNTQEEPPELGVVPIPAHNFVEQFSSFSFNSFLTKFEVIQALVKVRAECNRVLAVGTVPGSQVGFLNSNIMKTGRLDEFEHVQNTAITSFATMLQENWVVTIKNHINNCLKNVGKGWFNLRETSKEVYEFSKLKKFLMMVNFMMQDTLRYFVEDSLTAYAKFLKTACEGVVTIRGPNDADVAFPPDAPSGRSRRPPLFSLDLAVERVMQRVQVKRMVEVKEEEEGEKKKKEGGEKKKKKKKKKRMREVVTEEDKELEVFTYSTPLQAHMDSPVTMFDRALSSLQNITQVEKLVMDRLFWSHEPVLETVYPGEPWVQELRAQIQEGLAASTQPLEEYLKTYDTHLSFLRLNVDEYMEAVAEKHAEKLDLAAVQALVAKHQKEAQKVGDAIPYAINLGLYSVNCSEVRTLMVNKHKEIADKLLAFTAAKTQEKAVAITKAFDEIMIVLNRKPTNIEQLCELKEFMASVPDKVRELQKQIESNDACYRALESAHYQLARDQFDLEWRNFGWPGGIHEKMMDVTAFLEVQKDNHLKEMEVEQAQFEEALNRLHSDVLSLSQYKDLTRVAQVTTHVQTIKNKLADAVAQGRLFNSREGLFNKEITEYDKLGAIQKQFEPYCTLWETVGNWLKQHNEWMNDPFLSLNAEAMEKTHSVASKNMHRSVKAFQKGDTPGCLAIAQEIKAKVDEFKPHIPLVIALRNPGMRDRHWDDLSAQLGFPLKPDDSFTLTHVFKLALHEHIDLITKVGERAGKEYQIELALQKMNNEWADVDMQIEPYRNTGTFVLKGVDDLMALLDEHVTMTQAMTFSAFKKPFAEQLDAWAETLNTVSDVLEEWIKVQRSWLYLQPIFDSADIQKQLPTEYKRFSTVDKNWRSTLAAAKAKPKAIKFCANEKLLEKFQESSKFLDLVQKGLSDYLETKRAAFARFYFLSNDELLEILSQTKDPEAVQPHLKKCFEGIRRVEFNDNVEIVSMLSGEKERVDYLAPIDPKGKNVEDWMNEVEGGMREAVHKVMYDALVQYLEVPRDQWTLNWPGQVVLNASQTHWTREIEEAMIKSGAAGVKACYEQQLQQLQVMVDQVRGELPKLARITLGALCVVDVHARDVTKKLVASGVKTANDFEWVSQMRYYWDEVGKAEAGPDGDLWVVMVQSRRPYGYEYLGNSWRLVITPLTDKCYLTLMGALQMNLGGAPAGPAGTGKTETVKDLAKGIGKQCVVFNCSDGLDYLAMGKFFKGLASCGAWACFDEFNRIDVEVLSVVAQQILTLQNGVNMGMDRIMFEDSDINLDPNFAVYITMNPGYAGRTELPDNLKALFRPVAMMVPDYALIGEIMLFSFGFSHGLSCAQKMVATFTLCSEQLSSQDHYDYGMRAVKTVITAAGNLKRKDPDMDERVLLLRALQDVNLPKFLAHDLPLFEGIMSDLFPGISRPVIDYGALLKALTFCTEQHKLQPVQKFMTKCIQLYETIVVRHGLMVVGPTGGGKSRIISVLRDSLTRLADHNLEGNKYQKVKAHYINPKSITMGQLYGQFDPNTHEWEDGIIADMIRSCAAAETDDLKWVVFDGPVDALWIENMNTVLDDNKKLCLVSGEIIGLSDTMNIIFEPEDLAVASPATVSRCGMVYTEPHSLGLDPIITSWLQYHLPDTFTADMRTKLLHLFDCYVIGTLYNMRRNLTEPVPTVDNNLVQSLERLLDCYFEPFFTKEGRDPPTPEAMEKLAANLEPLFMFALVWSVAATVNADGRRRLNGFLRNEMANHGFSVPFPDAGTVYDYAFNQETSTWQRWMDTVEPYQYNAKLSFAELIIPTKDSVRYKYLSAMLLQNNKHVLMSGPTGTGKTINASEMLSTELPKKYVPVVLTFSAQTSANQTQDIIDSKLEKRSRGVYGPTAGTRYILFVDDFNMPQREVYFAQPPIELLRQWCDYAGWYDRKERTFRKVIDTILLAAMGPPGGGRNPITPRMLRHFNIINYTDMDNESMTVIFHTILRNFLGVFDEEIRPLCDGVVESCVEVYNTIIKDLLPTPSKPHYTYNLRDLGKVFQGLLMADNRKLTDPAGFLRMVVHEQYRVFRDRLVNDADCEWFSKLVRSSLDSKVPIKWEEFMGDRDRVFFGDYMVPGADPKIYEEVQDLTQLVPTIEEYLADYNAESKNPMKLVMFLDAIEHVSRISRIIRQPQGNALLLGVGGSGRQSLTRLATFMADYELFQIEISKGYGKNEWREDIKKCLLTAGLEAKPIVFLFTDSQIVFEGMVEDINNILNGGDVPNLYAPEDMDQIITTCRRDCLTKRIQPTKINIFAQYILRVRQNIHVVVALSPMGSAFRDRLRMFPSLVNCCTIDWFSEWPEEALRSVATNSITETDLKLGDHIDGIVDFFKLVHQGVAHVSTEYFEVLRRHNYVTPTSYLELLATFKTVLSLKRKEVGEMRNRLQIGLDKLISTASQVAKLQVELRDMQPKLVETQKEVEEMLVVIDKDKASAAETKTVVEKEESAAQEMAAETKAIAEDAQRDLDEALPALDAAVACLNKLKKSDIDEVRSMKKPPGGVVLTIHAACIMFKVKPVLKNDPNNLGKKIKDYWEAANKSILSDANKFLGSMKSYDKDNIEEKVISEITPFMDNPEFTFDKVDRSSKACSGVCLWVRAMYKYYHVARDVEPKKKRLREAQETLDKTLAKLNEAKARLKAVMDRLDELERNFNEAMARKEQLALDVQMCQERLVRAQKLIGGLGGEKDRWTETVAKLNDAYTNVLGDALVSSSTIAYLGAFTSQFRAKLVGTWQEALLRLNVPHSPNCDLQQTLADPVQVRAWNIAGLPTDQSSIENGIIISQARRWPLMIDPQGQANRFIKNLGKDAENGLDVVRETEKNFLRSLENGIRFGKWVLLENIGEALDAALEPVLLQQKFKQGGTEMIRLGDSTIAYNDTFRFFMTTKLPNPHYQPEVAVKVSLLNFTITPRGLEDQMLGIFVVNELPEMEERKNTLVMQNAAMKKQLVDIENKILFMLSNAKGNILDDKELIDVLSQSKEIAVEIQQKVSEAEETEKEIDATRELYRPVAFRASILYFAITDLAAVDPMYQYSLQWYSTLFVKAIRDSEPADEIPQRITNLNEYFTYSIYKNVCRSLFEKDKLMFSFLITVKVLQGDNEIPPDEWRFLISGQANKLEREQPQRGPSDEWITPLIWSELCTCAGLPAFGEQFLIDFEANTAKWKALFDDGEAHEHPIPGGDWNTKLSMLQKMCVLRCMRPDKMIQAVQNFCSAKLDPKFIVPPPFDLAGCFEDSSVISPLIFVLSTGSDPTKAFYNFADNVGMRRKVDAISLGQGQGVLAARLIEEAQQKGSWVLLQNCHLASSWMSDLERICEAIDPAQVSKDFRLWLTSMPSKTFPVSVLQNGVKMTNEPPKGLRQNVRNFYYQLNDEMLNVTSKPREFQKLLFGLSFFHANVQERKKFGPLGWNVPYEFNGSDLEISKRQLELFLDSYDEVPYQVLNFLTSYINYGGRVTDDKDLRTIDVILKDYFQPAVMSDDYKFSDSGRYYSFGADPDSPHQSYMDYIDSLPLNPDPEVFGMHSNANITCDQNETFTMFETILGLQPRTSSGGGKTREEIIAELAKGIEERLPEPFDVEAIGMQYPVVYEESMNTVLVQECIRYNKLLVVMIQTLAEIQKALKGLVVMSATLEDMGVSLHSARVPEVWEAKAYPSLKPLAPWTDELVARVEFIGNWVANGKPALYWISGFYFPQAFLTGTLQNYARKYQLPIDTLSFDFLVQTTTPAEITEEPADGCYIYGLFLEGARYDAETKAVNDSLPKQLYTELPPLHLLPIQDRAAPTEGVYMCPVYKILSRCGTLSTTGHSTNFVMWIELPSDRKNIVNNVGKVDTDVWIKAGVAAFCSLRY